MTRRISKCETLMNSVFPTAISTTALITNMQQPRIYKYVRGLIKIVVLPFGKLIDLFSPIILKEIINVLSSPDPKNTKGELLGYQVGSQQLFYLYAGTWLGSQLLSVLINYLIEGDAVLAARMRLVEYVEKHIQLDLIQNDHAVGKYLDDIKGIDRAIREGSKSMFDLWSLGSEFLSIIFIFDYYYKNHFTKTFITIPFIYLFTAAIDVFLNLLYALPFKKSASSFMSIAEEIFSNYRTIHLFNGYDEETKAYDRAMNKVEDTYRKKGLILSVFSMIQKIILGAGLYSIADILGNSIEDPTTPYTVGDFIVLTALYLKFVIPLSKLGDTVRELATQNAYLGAFVNKMNTLPTSKLNASSTGNYNFNEMKPTITFKNVNFSYPQSVDEDKARSIPKFIKCLINLEDDNNNKTIQRDQKTRFSLDNVSFKIRPGEITALLGPNGSGKSTIVDLIYRFYDLPSINMIPPSGLIKLNDIDLHLININSLREHIGISSLYSHIFKFRTIKDNILYGLIDKNLKLADILARLQLSALDSINSLNIERKQDISSGQGQQIKMLRVLLKKPSIYIFDEPTATLDEKSREIVKQKIYSLRDPNRIVLIISHDSDDIKDADHKITIEKGKIVHDTHPPKDSKHGQNSRTGGVVSLTINNQVTLLPTPRDNTSHTDTRSDTQPYTVAPS